MNKFYPVAGMVALSAVTTACQQADKQEKKQYNIVYIMTDDHTAQMMSCYDARYMETPNLDRIANEGVRFTNSFVANSLLPESCSSACTKYLPSVQSPALSIVITAVPAVPLKPVRK